MPGSTVDAVGQPDAQRPAGPVQADPDGDRLEVEQSGGFGQTEPLDVAQSDHDALQRRKTIDRVEDEVPGLLGFG